MAWWKKQCLEDFRMCTAAVPAVENIWLSFSLKRFQGDVDVITIPGVRCHPLDPSNDPAFSPSIRDHGIACKTIFDCTVPYDLKDRFHRARFMELDPEKWLKK